MKKILPLLFLPFFSYPQVNHVPLGLPGRDTIDISNINSLGSAEYDTMPKNLKPTSFAPYGVFGKGNLNYKDNYTANGFNRVRDVGHEDDVCMETLNDSIIVIFTSVKPMGHVANLSKIYMSKYNTHTKQYISMDSIFSSIYDCRNMSSAITLSGRLSLMFRQFNATTSTPVSTGSIYSDDGGVTWSSYSIITGTSHADGTPYGRIREIRGSYYALLYSLAWCDIFKSTDGATWSYYSTPYDNTGGGLQLTEPEIVFLNGDSILLLAREENNPYHQFTSTDLGLNFSYVGETNMTEDYYTVAPFMHYDSTKDELLSISTGRTFPNNRGFNSSLFFYVNKKAEVWNNPTAWSLVDSLRRPEPNTFSMYGYPVAVKIDDSSFFGLAVDRWRDQSATTISDNFEKSGIYQFSFNYRSSNLPDQEEYLYGYQYWDGIKNKWSIRNPYQGFNYNPDDKLITAIDEGSIFELNADVNNPNNEVFRIRNPSYVRNNVWYGNGNSYQAGVDSLTGRSVHVGNSLQTGNDTTIGLKYTTTLLVGGGPLLGNSNTTIYNASTPVGTNSAIYSLGLVTGVNSAYNIIALSALNSSGTTVFANIGLIPNSNGLAIRVGPTASNLLVSGPAHFFINSSGNTAFNNDKTTTAKVHIGAGSATAGTAPLKYTSGPLNTTAEVGAQEFLTDKFYGTITTGAARKEYTLNDVALNSGIVPITTTSGRLTNTTVTGAEAGYLSGVTSAIQTQLNTRAIATTLTGSGNGVSTAISVTLPASSTFAMVGAANAAAAGITYWTVSGTTLTINYAVAPASGTNNLSYWISYK